LILSSPSPSGGTSCRDLIDRPIFIVSTPRSGSTLLFETLVRAPALFTTGEESHRRIEMIGDLHPRNRGWTSNRLLAEEATSPLVDALADNFYPYLRDRSGDQAVGPVRMLEKTPKNALRVPFFAAAWPDSIFVYLYREPRQTLASMIEAWSTGRFRTYPGLPGWVGQPWSLLLVPGWRELVGRPLPEVVAAQWAITTDILVSDLEELPKGRARTLEYDRFVDDPQGAMERLTASLGLGWDQQLGMTLPPSRFTTSKPSRDKWMRLAPVIEGLLPGVEKADQRARRFLEKFG
jgi:hypothetical protein